LAVIADWVLPARNLGFASTASGASSAAIDLRHLSNQVTEDAFSGSTVSLTSGESLRRIAEAYEEAAVPNWDGYGAAPVSAAARAWAEFVVSLLPTTLPPPEVAPDPDGELTLEWYRGPGRVFAFSIRPDGRLSYAGMFGRATSHGTEFLENELPRAITRNLARLFAERLV